MNIEEVHKSVNDAISNVRRYTHHLSQLDEAARQAWYEHLRQRIADGNPVRDGRFDVALDAFLAGFEAGEASE